MADTDAPTAPRRAHCLCGSVELQFDAAPLWVTHCHCHHCRRAHGAGVVTWVGFPTDSREIRSGGDAFRRYRTETDAVRSFCGTCGTPMTYESERWPGEVHVAVGVLADARGLEPRGHVYADRAPEWCPIQDELPRHGGDSGTEPLG